MYLAVKEIKHEKLRYSLIIAMVILISYLIFVLTSLALGLAKENTSAIDSWNFNKIVLNKDADINLRQSLLTKEQTETFKTDKKIAFLGQANIVVKEKAHPQVSATFIGIKPDQFLYQELEVSAGKKPTRADQVIVDSSFENKGYHLNDKIYFNSQEKPYQIVGFTKNAMLNVTPVVYGQLEAWSALKNITPNFSASALLTKETPKEALAPELKAYSKQELIEQLPGYEAQNKTFTFMIAFLMIISLIVIAVFLYIITIQKLPNYAVLRVQGISKKVLIENTVSQAILLVLAGLCGGSLLTGLTALFIPASVPMAFDLKLLSLMALLLLLISILGSFVSANTIAKIDPTKVLGN